MWNVGGWLGWTQTNHKRGNQIDFPAVAVAVAVAVSRNVSIL